MLDYIKKGFAALVLSCLAACGGTGSSGSTTTVYGSAGDTTGASWNLNAVAYGNGVYVAVGSGGLGSGQGDTIGAWVETSSDGLNWTPQDTGEGSLKSGSYDAIAFGAGLFIAVDNSYNRAYESSNGKTWTRILTGTQPNGVSWDGNEFLLFTETSGIEVSADGAHWKAVPQPTVGIDIPVSAPIEYNGKWFSIIDDGPSVGIGVSSDLKTFTELVPSAVSDEYSGLTFGNGVLFAYGNDGLITTSPDGVTWTDSPVTTGDTFNQVLFNGVVYVASAFEPAANGQSANEVLLYSSDGISWSNASIDPAAKGKISFGYIAIGQKGAFIVVNGVYSLVSQDGVNWIMGGG